MTDPNSRYHGLPVRETGPEEARIPFRARRILPDPARFTAFAHVDLAGGERIDALAAEAMGDPLLYWRIVDADGAADPAEATARPRKRLALPLPLEVSDGRA
ncbi:hypothetical protein ACQ5SO_10180 [Rhodovulum sp. DZ06]|uniref:hypothetical protein n=1 Tax=Rhodovulum sp. DZ06 TaxID=3425126 RepID=UPI003D337FBB